MNKLAKLRTAGLVLALAFTLTACEGGDSPKSLAKQSYEIQQEAIKLGKEGVKTGDPKLVELNNKLEAVGKKIDLLSEEDKKILQDEFTRLKKEKK